MPAGAERLQELAFEEMAAGAVLDLDHPEIGVALHRTRDIGIGFRLGDEPVLEGGEPAELAVDPTLLGQHPAAEVELVELQQRHAAHSLATMGHGDGNAFLAEAPDMSLEPEFGGKTVVAHGSRARIAW